MYFTLSNAPEYVIKNIENLQQIWLERCKAIEKNQEGSYSRHLLLILHDLREEIQNNKNRFSQNAYGKKFFKIQFSTYCSFKKEQLDDLDKIRRVWTIEVDRELYFITEALSDSKSKFELDDISILIKRIEEKITSKNSLRKVIKILYDKILEKDLNSNQIEFIVDTIIILFNSKGMLELKSILNDQFQKFEDIGTDPEQVYLYPTLFGSPSRDVKLLDEHKEELKKYYEASSIKQRLNFLIEIYCLEPQSYKVIFKITGVKFKKKINIGKVELYRPKIDGKYIKENEIIGIFEDNSDYCVAVDIRGVDSKFMKIKAQQMAERTIAVLSTRNRKDQAIILSSDWVICDSQGEIRAFNFKGGDKPQTIRYNSIDSQNNQQRLGQWISSEDICHPTVAKWLASIDWYRRATEASQSSEEILNSWFAVEKFSDSSKTICKKLPELSDALKNKKKILKENIDLWIDSEGIRTVQLLLVLSELKFNLYHKVRQVGGVFITPLTFPLMDISKSINQDLQDYLSANKDEIDFLEKFIEKVPEIKKQLDSKSIVLPDLNQVNEIFYNHDYCEQYLIEKIIALKDDVYNIYRIRNMLVHSSSTTSRLFDYYAKRSREYCNSLLDAIAYKIYQTSNDDEIMPLESYFREMVIDANIALEAVKDNKMDKFINWALS
ncbi:hypothetical protein [Nostoc sp. 'Peltigera malacea cyanobiont' DB3992]|uniref:hypothetical protein n=1 Tax=Nostoc sp. 'Peltigera malacea cyanobiont' DB3992 TaxID=1206980 RepID=UPI000C0612D4|nr:hypothetical protein [Nostoc sp. 'Peltigera malacea cyanobiont' DB3992]PHM07666.1 hypothetical protein CK516_25600 [Nostoc sp. 'Peltigera malacea cyanobiont' DB3992]